MVLVATFGGATAAMIEGEWNVIHYVTIEDINVIRQRVDTQPNFRIAIHMREVAFIDSSKIAFGGYAWKGWSADWGTILHYPKVILTNKKIATWRVEALGSLGMD